MGSIARIRPQLHRHCERVRRDALAVEDAQKPLEILPLSTFFFCFFKTYFLGSERPTFCYFKPTLIFFVVRHFTRPAPCHDVTLYIMTHRGSRSIPTVHQCPSGVGSLSHEAKPFAKEYAHSPLPTWQRSRVQWQEHVHTQPSLNHFLHQYARTVISVGLGPDSKTLVTLW